MSESSLSLTRRSVRAVRLFALVPRLSLYLVLFLVAVGGVRSALRGSAATPRAAAPVAAGDLGLESLAESFARAYLSWDASNPEDHQRNVAAYLPGELADAGDPVVPSGSRHVLWSQVASDEPASGGRRTVVVEAQTDGGLTYLAVPVARRPQGVVVTGYPAIVGPPAIATAATPPAEDAIADPELEAVLRRALANYLAGQASNLRADLTAAAVISLPLEPLTLRSVDELTWAAPGIAAAQLTAASRDGTVWALRYELRVVKSDRWYVAALANESFEGG